MEQRNAFAKYQIIEEIGRGGFGIVYKAKDPGLGRFVAIKILHPALTVDSEFIERFKHEARIAAHMDHPNIVPVYDFGQDAGYYYLVMAYMPGGSLSTRIKRFGKMPEELVKKISFEIGLGLSYAHAHHIVHRDLKPSNILFDEKGIARVSDMSFAKVLHGNIGASLTATGQMVGTPSYMPPEAWKGQMATPASDVYGLACIMVEMFTGRPLFDGDSTPEIMLKHFQPRIIPEAVPKQYRDGIAIALAESPQNRFATVRSFLTFLDNPNTHSRINKPYNPATKPKSFRQNPMGSKQIESWLVRGLIGFLVLLMVVAIIGGRKYLASSKNQSKIYSKTNVLQGQQEPNLESSSDKTRMAASSQDGNQPPTELTGNLPVGETEPTELPQTIDTPKPTDSPAPIPTPESVAPKLEVYRNCYGGFSQNYGNNVCVSGWYQSQTGSLEVRFTHGNMDINLYKLKINQAEYSCNTNGPNYFKCIGPSQPFGTPLDLEFYDKQSNELLGKTTYSFMLPTATSVPTRAPTKEPSRTPTRTPTRDKYGN